jgi:hypothetical protein
VPDDRRAGVVFAIAAQAEIFLSYFGLSRRSHKLAWDYKILFLSIVL